MKEIIIDGLVYDLVPREQYSDWRLPTRAELFSLVDDKEYSHTNNFEEHTNYWSSTIDTSTPEHVWVVVSSSAGHQNSHYKGNSNYVRLVRNGTNGLEWSKTVGKMDWHKAIAYHLTAPIYYKGK